MTHDPTMLDRIRKLLAQAEATPFDEEAKAFTAKAQELMSRYSIDEAMFSDLHPDQRKEPIVKQVDVDEPYGKAKARLLYAISDANRCRMVQNSTATTKYETTADANNRPVRRKVGKVRRCWVAGMPQDVDNVEMLYTSLLVQSAHEMARATKPSWENGVTWRNNFIYGYASAIGGRLQRANREQVQAATVATPGVALVLASQKERVAAAVNEKFGRLRSGPSDTYARSSGYGAGRDAAARANLGKGIGGGRKALGS